MESLSRMTSHADMVGRTENTVELIANGGLYANRVKPVLDIVGGVILLAVLSPLVLFATLLAWVSLGRPTIYKQDRIGQDGKVFQLYKLRTMIPDRRTGPGGYVGPERRQTHKSPNDPRVTRIGHILRAFRLDELPQLVNVIKGDMSIVGPRPELPEIVATYEDWQHQRHIVRPGLTGLWQVSAQNGKPMHECTDVDIEYITRMSARTDLAILLRTPAAMLHRRGY